MLKKNLFKGIVLLPLVISTCAYAVQLDYRHQYLNKSEQHADRIRISHRFENNLSFALEAKWTSKKVDGDSRIYDNLLSSGQDFEIGYLYKINDTFSLSPAISMDASSSSTTYKGQVKLDYKATSELSMSARYRYGVKDYDRSVPNHKDSEHYHQGNFVVGYKFTHFSASYDFQIKQLRDTIGWNNQKRDYEHNLSIQVPVNKTWVPFGEIGYITYKDKSTQYKEDWEFRYRLGVKYNM